MKKTESLKKFNSPEILKRGSILGSKTNFKEKDKDKDHNNSTINNGSMRKAESLKKFNSSKKPLFRSTSVLETQLNSFKMLDNSTEKSPEKLKRGSILSTHNDSINDGQNKLMIFASPTHMSQNHRSSMSSPSMNFGKDTPSGKTLSQNNLRNFEGRSNLPHLLHLSHLPHKSYEWMNKMMDKKVIARNSISSPVDFTKDKELSKDINKENMSYSDNTQNIPVQPSPNYTNQIQARIGASKSSNIKVVVRFRPLNEVETEFISSNVGFVTCEFPANDITSVTIKSDQLSSYTSSSSSYKYDKVFNLNTTQMDFYDFTGKETILDVCNGYNGTIFTYGQSGSGKTFTMYGSDIYDDESKGLIPRAIDHLFKVIEDSGEDSVFQLKFSIMQIYKEVIYDLLTGEKDLKVKESPVKGIYVEGLSEFYIDNTESFLELLQMSQEQRIVSGTKLNQFSSRSHTIFVLEVTQTLTRHNITKRGILNLVDLAGTEKVSKTGSVGETLEEAKKINRSLSALGNVIHSLTTNSDHIPYRDSKLTRILQESLGGNYKTTLIVACSPHSYHLEETISSLKFAQRAKTIKNKIKMNVKLSYEELQKIIANLRKEIEFANKEIYCLKDILKGSNNVGENIINLLETQNVMNSLQTELVNSEKKLLEASEEMKECAIANAEVQQNTSNINIVNNNTASSVNIFLPGSSKENIDKTLKKLNLMNRRSSFTDSSVKNSLKSILGNSFKEFESSYAKKNNTAANESIESKGKSDVSSKSSFYSRDSNNSGVSVNSIKSSGSSHNIFDDSVSSHSSQRKSKKKKKNKEKEKYNSSKLRKQSNDKDKHLKELEEKIKKLEKTINLKDEIIKLSGKDLFNDCKEVYEKLNRDVKISSINNLNFNRFGSLVMNMDNNHLLTQPNVNESSLNNTTGNIPTNNNFPNLLDTPNIDILNLNEKLSNTLFSFDKILKIISDKADEENKRILSSTFNIDKLKAALLNNNMENESKIISSLIQDESELKENIFSCGFMKNLQYKLNIDLTEAYNTNLLNQNKILNNQNEILLGLLVDMMGVNQKLFVRLESNEKNLGSSDNFLIRANDSHKSIKANMCQNKIAKFITMKNVNAIKAANRRSSLDYGLLLTLKQFQSGNSLRHVSEIPPVPNINIINENEEDYSDAKSYNNNHIAGSLNNKALEKFQEQINSLKEFILKSFKEAQKVKKTFSIMMQDINLIGSLGETTSRNRKINFVSDKTCECQKSNLIRNTDSDDETVTIINSLTNSPNSIRSNMKNLIGKIHKLEEIDEADEFSPSAMIPTPQKYPSFVKNDELSPTHNRLSSIIKLEQEELKNFTLENKTSRKSSITLEINNSDYYFNNSNNMKEDLEKNQNSSLLMVNRTKSSLDKLFERYSSTGSASKRFDGIAIKLNKNIGFSFEYNGGLNCMNNIGSPHHRKLESAVGDHSIPSIDDDN